MKTLRSNPKTAVKVQALRQSGTFTPRAGAIRDRLFLEERFFDPQDLTQVKYEMLRRVEKEDLPISAVAASFGFSRPAFYKARRDFISEGLGGLIARRRGPKEGHKVTSEIVSFVERTRAQESSIAMPELVRRIQNEFAVLLHRRSVERALVAAKKKRGKA